MCSACLSYRTVWVDGATASNNQQEQEEQQNDLQYVGLIILSYTITWWVHEKSFSLAQHQIHAQDHHNPSVCPSEDVDVKRPLETQAAAGRKQEVVSYSGNVINSYQFCHFLAKLILLLLFLILLLRLPMMGPFVDFFGAPHQPSYVPHFSFFIQESNRSLIALNGSNGISSLLHIVKLI